MVLGFRYLIKGHNIIGVQAAKNAITDMNNYDVTLNAYKDGGCQIHTDKELPPDILTELKKKYVIVGLDE